MQKIKIGETTLTREPVHLDLKDIKVLSICGPTGSGKTHLIQQISYHCADMGAISSIQFNDFYHQLPGEFAKKLNKLVTEINSRYTIVQNNEDDLMKFSKLDIFVIEPFLEAIHLMKRQGIDLMKELEKLKEYELGIRVILPQTVHYKTNPSVFSLMRRVADDNLIYLTHENSKGVNKYSGKQIKTSTDFIPQRFI